MQQPLINRIFYLALTGLVLTCACAGAQTATQEKDRAAIKNPVIDEDFPDPTVIRAGEKYYAYATQSTMEGRVSNIQIASSSDLQHWTLERDALPVKPTWADRDFWAPHVLYDEMLKKYVLFYSAESADASIGKCIGIAFAAGPLGPFVDKGSPLICGEGFINIDPMAIIDPSTKKRLLYWGSGFGPIKVREMNNDWTGFDPGSQTRPVVWPNKGAGYGHLVEGAWLDVNEGQYYLYYSGDNCCGDKAHYAVMVARAADPYGPFNTLGAENGSGNSVILEKSKHWTAPGHNSIFRDEKGNAWIAYHAIRKRKDRIGTLRVMCIRPVEYRQGWPVVIKE